MRSRRSHQALLLPELLDPAESDRLQLDERQSVEAAALQELDAVLLQRIHHLP
jgi:hypothetical protein